MMPAKQSVAFVGNSSSLDNSEAGAWIDAHDIVIRFNECALRGFENDVGARTDILVSNPYVEARARPPLDGVGAPKVVLVINPQTRRGDKEEFSSWIGNHPVLFSYSPDIRSATRPRSDVALTTGSYALSLLCKLLKPRQLSIIGFTLFLDGASGHYWSQTTPPGRSKHKPLREAEIFIDLINSMPADIAVAEDIEWVSQVVGVPLRRDIQVRPLPGWSASNRPNSALVRLLPRHD